MSGDEVLRTIQTVARADAAARGVPVATQEHLLRHALGSFLARLTQTPHAQDFVLKGGLWLGAYVVRRPTKDADSNAISADVNPAHLRRVIQDISAVEAGDGAQFLLDTLAAADIRENARYLGVRVRVRASMGSWQSVIA